MVCQLQEIRGEKIDGEDQTDSRVVWWLLSPPPAPIFVNCNSLGKQIYDGLRALLEIDIKTDI